MSGNKSKELPLWVQDRDKVIESAGSEVKWREQAPPDYTMQKESFAKGKKYNHPEGSLEALVQNLVRTFEMEVSHKSNPQQWLSVVADQFKITTNGKQTYNSEDVAKEGSYNLFIEPTEHYNPKEETFESSAELFHEAFPEGFLWEVSEVISGPPKVVFKWRHWGNFTGPYRDFQPTGKTIEICGISVANVTEELKITTMEHYFDNSAFLNDLTAGCPIHKNGQS